MKITLASTTAPALPGHAVASADPNAAWKPVPELVGRRGVPWVDKTYIETTAEAAAKGVLARYDANGDGVLDRRTESTHEDIAMYWANADGSRWSGYTQPEHLATLKTTTSIDALLAAASPAGSTEPVQAAALVAAFAKFDTDHDGRLTWNEGRKDVYFDWFPDLVKAVGELTVSAERIIS